MLDFTSALYLGLRHPGAALGPWEALTTGRPAALGEPPGAPALAARVAALQGLEAGVVLPSTLHLFRDVFALLAADDTAVLVDEAAYPIARWAAALAGRGRPPRAVAHFDAGALAEAAGALARRGFRPIVLCDGLCPGCGRTAPLAEHAAVVERHGGVLVVDDTQALGVTGERADAQALRGLQAPPGMETTLGTKATLGMEASLGMEAPLGTGGGGSPRWCAVRSPHVLVGASLAKAFGAPLAVLSGSARLVGRLRRASQSLVHCSPPAVPVIRAALRALAINRGCGDALRARLCALVRRLQAWAARAGLLPAGPLPLPVQPFGAACPVALQRALLELGVRTVVTRGCREPAGRLTFVLTARHGEHDIDRAGALLARAARALAARAARAAP